MMAAAAHAEDRTLTVYLQHAEAAGLVNVNVAKGIASKIFAGVGVRVIWKAGAPAAPDRDVLTVIFDGAVSEAAHPGALAYAHPFGAGSAIHILADRVLSSGPRSLVPTILGHTLAHEIGHVLERTNSHSGAGVMKAHWSPSDFHAMSMRPYSFAPGDVMLIDAYWTSRRSAADPVD